MLRHAGGPVPRMRTRASRRCTGTGPPPTARARRSRPRPRPRPPGRRQQCRECPQRPAQGDGAVSSPLSQGPLSPAARRRPAHGDTARSGLAGRSVPAQRASCFRTAHRRRSPPGARRAAESRTAPGTCRTRTARRTARTPAPPPRRGPDLLRHHTTRTASPRSPLGLQARTEHRATDTALLLVRLHLFRGKHVPAAQAGDLDQHRWACGLALRGRVFLVHHQATPTRRPPRTPAWRPLRTGHAQPARWRPVAG